MLRILQNIKCKTYGFRQFATESKPIGFIGMGFMGGRLATKLTSKGTKVLGYDVDPIKIQNVKNEGVDIAANPADVAEKTDIIFMLLPDYATIVEVCNGANGILRKSNKGTLIVDMSTIGPVNTIRLADALRERDVNLLSAPISGSIHSLDHDSIMFLAGGRKKFLEMANPYFEMMGIENRTHVIHIGEDVSDGQAVRVCAVLLLACTMCASSEVMNLGIRLGVKPQVLKHALCATSARCWACEYYNPVPNVLANSPATFKYKPGQSVATFRTGLGIAQDLATKLNSPIPLAAVACQMFSLAAARGFDAKDISIVYRLLKQTLLREE